MKKYEEKNIKYWENEGHKGIYGKSDGFLRKKFPPHEAKLFQNEDLKGKSIFEIGFGDGSDLNIFKNKYKMKISGIDINKEIVKNVKSKLKVKNLFCGKIENWFKNDKNKYDYIYSTWSLMSMNDKKMKKLLAEIQNHLKPNGKFIFAMLFGNEEFNWYEIMEMTYYSLNEERLTKILPKKLEIKTFLKSWYDYGKNKKFWDLGVVVEKIK